MYTWREEVRLVFFKINSSITISLYSISFITLFRRIVQEQEARASKMSPKRKITKKGRLSGFIGSNVRVNRRTIVYNGDQINGVWEGKIIDFRLH